MSQIDLKPRASAQFGCVAGLALLLFAGALVAAAQFGAEAPGSARRLVVVGQELSYNSGVVAVPAAAVPLNASFASGAAVPFSGVAAVPVAVPVVTPAPPVAVAPPVALGKVAALECADNAYLALQVNAGNVQISVKKAHSFIVGQKLAVGVGTLQQEDHYIKEVGTPSSSITLRHPLNFTHVAGAKICIQKLSLHQQFRHQFSTGPLDSLKSSDSSSGSFSDSSNSMTSVQSGSSADNLPKAFTASAGASAGGSWFFNFIIMLCYACCYKSKVVDVSMDFMNPKGPMPQQSHQHDLDDFQHGVCSCLGDINMCCMVTFCPFLRMAHTNAATNVFGFWNTLICLGCASLVPFGPCCLQVYFRIHIKDHMGIPDHCFNDMILAWCCLPCITGQQALSVDEVMGVHFKCPCHVESAQQRGWGSEQARMM